MNKTVAIPPHNVTPLFGFFRRPRRAPELTDGELELEVAQNVYAWLKCLPISGQHRALNHVMAIIDENQEKWEAFENQS